VPVPLNYYSVSYIGRVVFPSQLGRLGSVGVWGAQVPDVQRLMIAGAPVQEADVQRAMLAAVSGARSQEADVQRSMLAGVSGYLC
jgi:hypothetical protein